MNAANDIFLLMLNLSQMRSREKIIELFVGGIGSLFSPLVVLYSDHELPDVPLSFRIATRRSSYGYFVLTESDGLSDENKKLLHNAVQMFAIVLERLEFEKKLEVENLNVVQLAEERLVELEKTVDELQKARYASINVLEDLSSEIDVRQRAEAVLRESESRAKAMLEAIPDLMFRLNRQGVFLDYKADIKDLFVQTEPSLIGKRNRDYAPPELADLVDHYIHATLETGSLQIFEYALPVPGKGIREFEARMVPSGADEVTTIVRDVTARKRSDEAQRHAQKLESIGTLAGGIAHDFNNLLNAIMGQSSLALGKLPKESPAGSNISKAINAAERAADLTRQLLAYSGKGKFFTEEIDLNLLVKENVTLLEVSIPKTVQLRLELGSPSSRIRGDMGQIQQVIMNLIINAGESMGQNPGSITVRTSRSEITQNDAGFWMHTVTPLAPGTYALVQVSDNGCGMNQETLSRIFDPFYTTKFTGRGLGLAAVLGIIRGHNGGIRIQSHEGKGTQFEIVFPLVESDAAATLHDAQPAGIVDGNNQTILVIDDEPSVLELLTDIFTDAKFTVIRASKPMEGIELYRQNRDRIAIVVLDYSMPDMDGRATFEELVKIKNDVKVLLCSGYTEEEMMAAFGTVRPAGFIHKPYQPSALLQKVQRILSEGR